MHLPSRGDSGRIETTQDVYIVSIERSIDAAPGVPHLFALWPDAALESADRLPITQVPSSAALAALAR